MPVAHQPLAAVVGQIVGMAAEQSRHFHLDGLRQQHSRPIAQNLGQRIGKSSWLGELENVSVGHGVSLVWDDYCQPYFSRFLAPMVGSGLRIGADPLSQTKRRFATERDLELEAKQSEGSSPFSADHRAAYLYRQVLWGPEP